jgi:hypothetical protein
MDPGLGFREWRFILLLGKSGGCEHVVGGDEEDSNSKVVLCSSVRKISEFFSLECSY